MSNIDYEAAAKAHTEVMFGTPSKPGAQDWELDLQAAKAAVDAALAGAEKVAWCVEHRAELLSIDRDTGEQFCWKQHMNFLPLPVNPYRPCRMVKARLVVGPLDET